MPSPEAAVQGNWSEHRFVSFDETPIFYRRYSALNPPRGFVLALHGMGEHSGRYREFAEMLGGAGFEVTLPDLRGFGRSGGKRGCLRRFDDYFPDLDVLAREIKQRSAGLPWFVLGHSFGGLIASSWLAGERGTGPRGLILTSPNFGIAIRVPVWRKTAAVITSYLAPDFTQDNRVETDLLTHDKSVLEKSKLDRLVHHRISVRLYVELLRQLTRKRAIAAALSLPVLLLQAGDDHIVSKEASLLFFDLLGSPDKTLEVFPGLYHEILNETDRRAIYTKILEWINHRL